MRNRHVYILSAVLAIIGLATFVHKWLVIGLPLHEAQRAPAWEVEVQYRFEGTGKPLKLTTFAPQDSTRAQIYDQRFIGAGYGLSIAREQDNRQVIFTTRRANGAQSVFVRFVVHLAENNVAPPPRLRRPAPSELTGAKLAAAQAIAQEARAKSSDSASFVAAVLKALRGKDISDEARLLLGKSPTPLTAAKSASDILALANIPATAVTGTALTGRQTDVPFVHWLEAEADGKVTAYRLDRDEPGIPDNYLAWWRGGAPFTVLEGGRRLRETITVDQLEQPVLDRILAQGAAAKDKLITFSLFGLPLSVQQVYRVLMVVPIGVFLLLVLRNVIGLRGLGTFMPVLIAIAFRETQLVWGLILFSAILALGLLFRFYLEYLKLLLVPRLAAVLIFVILIMAGVSIFTNQLGLERGLSVALFPMVILTMTIERVSVLWDERGPAEALTQAVGSLAIASLCYVVMTFGPAEYLFFTFPELLLVLLAACMLLGRYSGFRLLELRRFRVLAGRDT